MIGRHESVTTGSVIVLNGPSSSGKTRRGSTHAPTGCPATPDRSTRTRIATRRTTPRSTPGRSTPTPRLLWYSRDGGLERGRGQHRLSIRLNWPAAERGRPTLMRMSASDQITIRLPDGSTTAVGTGTTAGDLAAEIGSGLRKAAVIAAVNGVERDLVWPLHDGDEVAIITTKDDRGLYTIRHSTAHVLAQAVLDLYPGATFGIGPPVEDGFYYDFELPGGEHFKEDDLPRVEARMREIIKEQQPFVRDEIDAEGARVLFKDHKYKLEIIDDASTDPMSATESGLVRTYENPPKFVDLCRGPHVEHTGRHLGHFQLMRVAGAYWRGDEKKPQLQRIYGTAWATKAELEDHLHRLEEAAKRDHRKLANELDLLSFPELLGGGLAVWHPKGAIVRKLMEDYSRQRHLDGGYEFAYTPHISNARLFETSGHLDFYADGMYPPMEMDNGSYYPKPMNCPGHILIYESRQRSYRELPLRLFELGTVYRYERAGTLHGLMRIRGFTQDDSHIFCTPEQAHDEIISLLRFVLSVLRAFGFEDFEANLSTKPKEKFVGTDEGWETCHRGLARRARRGRPRLRDRRRRRVVLRSEDRRARARRDRP